MTDIETYEFDRVGYLVVRDILPSDTIAALADAVDRLEAHALAHVADPPRKLSPRGAREYHASPLGYHAQGSNAEGATLIIEDFWNADPAFDVLLDHAPTMSYVRGIVQGRVTINNSELRIRYRGNQTGTHRPTGPKYTYAWNADGIDARMIRVVYFTQDVTADRGAFCVVPGTHKSNLQAPAAYGKDPDEEPGMIPLEVSAGDAIIFTENLRHGGFTNRSDQVRKTIHVGYGPYWLMSQNIATMDEPQFMLPSTLERLTPAQRELFSPWPLCT